MRQTAMRVERVDGFRSRIYRPGARETRSLYGWDEMSKTVGQSGLCFFKLDIPGDDRYFGAGTEERG